MNNLRKKFVISAILLAISISLTACGAGDPNSSSNSSQEFGTDSIESGIDSGADTGWTATEGDDGSGYAVTCDFSGDESEGDSVNCDVYWDAKNTSNIPLDYSGFTYLVVDGSVYQTSDGYAELRTVNPGSYAVQKGGSNSFSIPYGGYITALYKAEGPNEPHLLDLPLNIHIVNE